MLYSNDLQANIKELSVPVKECIKEIGKYFNSSDLPVLHYDEISIVVPVMINVSIPFQGTVGGIDIRPEEPVLIRIFSDLYPDLAPFVMSDRKDFPREKLSHLYVDSKDVPARFCLVRNSPHEWFANKSISDVLYIVAQWLFKAAGGMLNDDGNEFDPIRLERYRWEHIYKYETLVNVVNKNERLLPNIPFALLLGSGIGIENEITFKSFSPIPFLQIEAVKKMLVALSPQKQDIEQPIFSLLIWSDNMQPDADYFVELPRTYKDLKLLLSKSNVNLDAIIAFYQAGGFQKVNYIPLIYAIKRPRKMIGYNGDVEFVNFTIDGKYIKNTIPENAVVRNQRHIEPFTSHLAALVSGQQRNNHIFFLGAGSLGSKIIMHELRSGNKNISVADDDNLLQHNLVRHALYSNRIGMNKAVAMIKEAEQFFKFDSHTKLKSHDQKAILLNVKDIEGHTWFVDSTASFNVQNWLITTRLFDLAKDINISRCELADDGRLGLMYIEGTNRNPRIDDLINVVYYESLNVPAINEWRINDLNREVTNIDVGLGCSSTTSIVADDLISFHSATFSQVLYNERNRQNINEKGLVFINSVNTKGLLSVNSTSIIESPFSEIAFENNTDWEYRMRAGVEDKMLFLTKKAGINETGGVLVGIANYKTKTVHVLDMIEAPVDSKGTPGRFKRGIKNLPETIETIKAKTGNMIGYIGEWHSHPMGLETLSNVDLDNIEILKNENNKVPIPTCAVIISNNKTIPFIFF